MSKFTLLLAVVLAASPAMVLAGDYRAPLNAHGHPDIEGLWSNGYLTSMERPEELKALVPTPAEVAAYEKAKVGKPPTAQTGNVGADESEWWEHRPILARIRGQPRSSWIVSPADGQVPFSVQARERQQARRALRNANPTDPAGRSLNERCLEPTAAGPPLFNVGYNDNYQIIQTRDAVAIYTEQDHNTRIIRLGERHPPDGYRRWMGDSIGRWEGQTLVVETTNFTPHENGHPTIDTKAVERFTRISPTELFYEFTLTEPGILDQPLQGEMVLYPIKGPLFEVACHEGNYALEHILAAGDQPPAPKPAEGGAP